MPATEDAPVKGSTTVCPPLPEFPNFWKRLGARNDVPNEPLTASQSRLYNNETFGLDEWLCEAVSYRPAPANSSFPWLSSKTGNRTSTKAAFVVREPRKLFAGGIEASSPRNCSGSKFSCSVSVRDWPPTAILTGPDGRRPSSPLITASNDARVVMKSLSARVEMSGNSAGSLYWALPGAAYSELANGLRYWLFFGPRVPFTPAMTLDSRSS